MSKQPEQGQNEVYGTERTESAGGPDDEDVPLATASSNSAPISAKSLGMPQAAFGPQIE